MRTASLVGSACSGHPVEVTAGVRVEDLRRFGAPIFVPDSQSWAVAAVECTDGVPDGVLVFGDAGAVEVRTDSATRVRQPLSIRVENLQRAGRRRGHVIVDEVEQEILVAGVPHLLPVLQSQECFSFVLDVSSRVLCVAGRLEALDELAIAQLDDLSLLDPHLQ